MAIINLYCESSYVTAHIWQIRWQIYPPTNGNFRFLLIDSYSESSHVAEQVADLPPWKMEILDFYLQIPTLRAHMWQIYPPGKMVNLDSYTL